MNHVSKPFMKYLNSISPNKAVNHVVDCLVHGEPDNEAWALMEACHGPDWACTPEDLPQLIIEALGHVYTLDPKGPALETGE